MAAASLRQQAYEQILAWIRSDRLPKGSVTSEIQLSRMLDMSRTPIRAALQQLEVEGFLHIAPKQGILILDSSAQRVSDLLDLINALALFAFEQRRGDDAEARGRFAAVQQARFASLTATLPSPDPLQLALFELDVLQAWVARCHNGEMDRLLATTAERLFWPQNLRRWKPPFHLDTANHAGSWIGSLAAGETAEFAPLLLSYIQWLKQTWS